LVSFFVLIRGSFFPALSWPINGVRYSQWLVERYIGRRLNLKGAMVIGRELELLGGA